MSMQRRYLKGKIDVVEVEGQLSYQESSRTWSLLRLQQRIVEAFPMLRDKSAAVHYKGVLCQTKEKMEQILDMVKDGKVPIPLMVFLFQEGLK